MCKNLIRQFSLNSSVYESQETYCEAERELESLRLETEAIKKELLHQLQTAKEELDFALHSRRKCEKQIMKLENECRRLDNENQQLREELKKTKKNGRCKSELPPRFAMVSTYSQATSPVDKEDPSPQLYTISRQLTGLQNSCKEQGTRVSSCLAVLRKTRQDNAEIMEVVAQIQDALAAKKGAMMHRSTSESVSGEVVEMYRDQGDDYCRLLDEIQDMTDCEIVVEETIFQCHPEAEESYLLAAPIQEKMEHMEEEVSKIQESLFCNLAVSNNQKGKKDAASQTALCPDAVTHKRQKSSLARAYTRAVTLHWNTLV